MVTNKQRITKQQQVIHNYLKSVKTHPDVNTIYKEVRKRLPNISKGTVYRNLEQLKINGHVTEIFQNNISYDGDTSSHAHLICQQCKKILDVFEFTKIKLKNIKAGKINKYQLLFYGTCNQCQNRKD